MARSMGELILVINPGSTSTKLAIFNGEEPLCVDNLDHSGEEWAARYNTASQLPHRISITREYLKRCGVNARDLDCIVARGGLLRPVRSGAYAVNEYMKADLLHDVGGRHAANLGGLIAWTVGDVDRPAGGRVPSYIVDPVSVDEFAPEATISGVPAIPRRSLLHALNIRACARRAAEELGRPLEDLYLVVAHLGSGFSIAPCYRGRLRDVNNSNEEGPFTIERAGTLPALCLLDLAVESDLEELAGALTARSGMYCYTGTKDARKVEAQAASGGPAALPWEAMAYQVGKEISAMSAAYPEAPDAVVITGGLAKSAGFVAMVKEYTAFLGRHLVYPGEDEMEALAAGALRVLRGLEQPRTYPESERRRSVEQG